MTSLSHSEGKGHDSMKVEVSRLWEQGLDTYEIGRQLGILECTVYSMIAERQRAVAFARSYPNRFAAMVRT